MALRSGASYLEALKDGREVWLDGERVSDVTAHPQLAGCVTSLAENFDIQRDPANHDLLTAISPAIRATYWPAVAPAPVR